MGHKIFFVKIFFQLFASVNHVKSTITLCFLIYSHVKTPVSFILPLKNQIDCYLSNSRERNVFHGVEYLNAFLVICFFDICTRIIYILYLQGSYKRCCILRIFQYLRTVFTFNSRGKAEAYLCKIPMLASIIYRFLNGCPMYITFFFFIAILTERAFTEYVC